MNFDNRPIGVFDSGVGGLSILKELQKLLPDEDFVFVADQAFMPYGQKTPEELIKRSILISNYLILQHHAKIIVVACNTATCYAIEALREKYKNFQFIGTEPAVKPAALQTMSGEIAVLSTPATAKSAALTRLINECLSTNPNLVVHRVGCTGLEEAVEKGDLDSKEVGELLLEHTKRLPTSPPGIDSVVLGCTHYPFLKERIRGFMGLGIALYDSGEAIARQTSNILTSKGMSAQNNMLSMCHYFTTGDAEKFSRVASKLLGYSVFGSWCSIS